MAALDFLLPLENLYHKKLSKNEKSLLEADIFSQCYEAALKHSQKRYSGQLHTDLYAHTKDEEIMIDDKLIRCIINDIVESGAYTIPGISYHTHIPEDVLIDIATGLQINPSLNLSQKLLILHKSVRPNIYEHIYTKINHSLNAD